MVDKTGTLFYLCCQLPIGISGTCGLISAGLSLVASGVEGPFTSTVPM